MIRPEKKMLQYIFDPRRNQNTRKYGRRIKEEVTSILEDLYIVGTTKSKNIGWAEHVWRDLNKGIHE